MQILINLDSTHPIFPGDGIEPRAKALMESYIKERFFDSLMYQEEVQKDFAAWLEAHQSGSTASLQTKRQEIRKIRSAAEKGINTATLFREMDRLHFDARNNVPDKQVNFGLSHLIDTDFINRMAKEAQDLSASLTQRRGLMLFGATLMVGIRTSEWTTARLIQDNPPILPGETTAHPILVVQTVKTRNSDPDPRYLVLEGFSRGALGMIEACVEMTATMNNGHLGQLVRGMRQAMIRITDDPAALELIEHIDMKTARKIFTVESRRENRSPEAVSAALGHTTTNNLRWYAQGDIHCERITDIPLARASLNAAKKIRDPLAEFNERKQLAGGKSLTGYPDLGIQAPGTGQDTQNDATLADRLLNSQGNR